MGQPTIPKCRFCTNLQICDGFILGPSVMTWIQSGHATEKNCTLRRVCHAAAVMLVLRSLFAFLALPAVVAGLVPAMIVGSVPRHQAALAPGAAVFGSGTFFLLWCVRDFFVSGRGTLAPWDPPKHLVVVGLYRHVWNPMYVAVLMVIAGWSLLYASVWLTVYLVFLAGTFHLRVILYEEPWLQRQFGAEWHAYRDAVPRWVPRLRRKSG